MKRFFLFFLAIALLATSCSAGSQKTASSATKDESSKNVLAETDAALSSSTAAGIPDALAFDDPTLDESSTSDGRTTSSDTAKEPAIDYRDVSLPATSWVATAVGSNVEVSAQPEGAVTKSFPNPTQFGGPRVFHVLDLAHPTHVKVSLPSKPNGQEGWVLREDITLEEIDFKALVDLRNNSLTVWDGDDIIVRTQAVTGKASTPTPLGTFYVRDIIKKPNAGGAYGPYIVALSGFSETLETFAGGLPAIAIHGTNQPGLIGQSRSNGCIRIPNDLITQLAGNVPLGTPVTVVT